MPHSIDTANARHAGGKALTVDVSVLDQRWDAVRQLEAIAARAADCVVQQTGGLSETTIEISMVFTNDEHIATLNNDYRGKPSATNVLSFPSPSPGAGQPGRETLLGDVILSFETITSEARAQGKSFENHLCHLIVHGVLHLFGYDHSEDAGAEEMEALEIAILAQVGVPNPYECESC